MRKTISFHPEEEVYDIGTVVCPVIDPEYKMMITGIRIHSVDGNGFINNFDYICHGPENYCNFNHIEIKESLIQQNK